MNSRLNREAIQAAIDQVLTLPASGELDLEPIYALNPPSRDRAWRELVEKLLQKPTSLSFAWLVLGHALKDGQSDPAILRLMTELDRRGASGDPELVEALLDLLAEDPQNATLRAELVILLLENDRIEFATDVLEHLGPSTALPDWQQERLCRRLGQYGIGWQDSVEAFPQWDEADEQEFQDYRRQKSYAWATVLAIVPGLGFSHLYGGAFIRGIFLAVVQLVAVVLLIGEHLAFGAVLASLVFLCDLIGGLVLVWENHRALAEERARREAQSHE